MKTPIFDFANEYAKGGAVRAHMPGHKGKGALCEELDITEIVGADSLFEADGIIKQSEENASELFGAHTFYSTEGSSLSIRAAVYLLSLYAKEKGLAPLIAAARNAHKAFLSAIALTDADTVWLAPKEDASYLSCPVTAEDIRAFLANAKELPIAVYLTSPDYLGNVLDIAAIGEVCHSFGVLLCVDNAHGAYLKFLSPSRHPIDLGADICLDSAHKTLPVLTGGAYLHISKNAPSLFEKEAKDALCLFGSTSPSYLILQSLDRANAYLEAHRERLAEFTPLVEALRSALKERGFTLIGDEPLKLTLAPRAFGYTGKEIAYILERKNIVCEFSDSDYTVLMLTPENGVQALKKIKKALLSIDRKEPVPNTQPRFSLPERVMPIREAMLSPRETVPLANSIGRVLASPSVSCPPAVPIAVSGERIDENTARVMEYYGVTECLAVKL